MAITTTGRMIDGITCYAPERSEDYGSYPAEGFEVTVRVEEASFWCRSRNRLVRDLLKRFAPDGPRVRFLDIGCGTGNVLKSLRDLPGIELVGSEIYLGGLRHAKARLPGVEFIQLDATDMPFDREFDVIGAFDVIEHIEDDALVLRNVYRSLRDGGVVFITVPQYPWMWSRLDEVVRHKRRYTRDDLVSRVAAAGFRLAYVSSFVMTLFPAQALSRLASRRRSGAQGAEVEAEFAAAVQLPSVLNRMFDVVMRIDEGLIRHGVSLPFGGSLVVVARKPKIAHRSRRGSRPTTTRPS